MQRQYLYGQEQFHVVDNTICSNSSRIHVYAKYRVSLSANNPIEFMRQLGCNNFFSAVHMHVYRRDVKQAVLIDVLN